MTFFCKGTWGGKKININVNIFRNVKIVCLVASTTLFIKKCCPFQQGMRDLFIYRYR